ncbi:MAG TPA: P-loop NTPase fold protein, partial [Longimicrobium sp.]|nr:P-loop NTPase fold protein [Longimicrobium sp.]
MAADRTDPSADPLSALLQLFQTPRARGGVMLIREGASLETLQAAFVHATDPRCCTLRYRIQAGSVLGSLTRAVLGDLDMVRRGRAGELLGKPVPACDEPAWHDLDAALGADLATPPPAERGRIDVDDAGARLGGLQWPSSPGPGRRLTVFAEVVGSEGPGQSPEEWRQAAASLLPRLPSGVVLVIAGPPQGFDLPDDTLHYVEVPRLEGAAGYAETAGAASTRYQPAELLPDVPTTEDQLGRSAYAASLASFLLHPNTAPPITIGLYGRWGSGKSSFFELLRMRLLAAGETAWLQERAQVRVRKLLSLLGSWGARKPPRRPAAPRRTARPSPAPAAARERKPDPGTEARRKAQTEARARDRIVTIRFNAWQYDDAKQTWAGLASTVSEQIEAALPFRRRLAMRFRYAWKHHQSDLVLNLLLPALVLFAAAAFVFIRRGDVASAMGPAANANPLLTVLLPAGSFLLLVWTFGWRVVQVAKPISERVASYVRRHDYRADMGYQHKVIDDLKFLLAELSASR